MAKKFNSHKKSGKNSSYLSLKTKIGCIIVTFMAAVSAKLASVWPVRLGEIYNDISAEKYSTLKQFAIPALTLGCIYLLSEVISIVRRELLECIFL